MNIFSILGFFGIIAVVIAGVVTTITPKEYHLFLDLPAIFLVVGGTVGVAAFTVQLNRVGLLLKAFFLRLMKSKRIEYKNVVREVMISAEAFRRGDGLVDISEKSNDQFSSANL